jgi:flavin-dependent dehydrogenase
MGPSRRSGGAVHSFFCGDERIEKVRDQLAAGFDVVILGGGPAGTTTAILLADAGWSVALVEKTRFPRRKVCGEFVSATTFPILQQLGVFESFLEQAGPEVKRVGLFARDVALTSFLPKPPGISRGGRALGRERLDTLLLRRAANAGAAIYQPWAATRFAESDQGFVCSVVSREDGITREIRSRLVIAAHGSWEVGGLPSQVPRQPARASDLFAFKAHYRQANLAPDLMPLVVFPGGYGGMVHTDHGRVSISCCIRRGQLQQVRHAHPEKSAAEAVLHHITQSCAEARNTLARATLDGAWMSAGPLRTGIRRNPQSGIFLVGNAAGEAHPIIAEGISMAIQSAWLLCGELIRKKEAVLGGAGSRNVSSVYEKQWRLNFAGRVHAAACFAHLAMRPATVRVGLFFLRAFPRLLDYGAEWSGKARQATVLGGFTDGDALSSKRV